MYLSTALIFFITAYAQAKKCANPVLVNPVPQSSICGVAGQPAKATVLQTFTNPAQPFFCIDKCTSNTKCKSFSVTKDGASCALYTTALTKATFTKDTSSSRVYFNSACFTCKTTVCKKGRNLIQDSGFELADTILPWSYNKNGQSTDSGFFAPGSDGTGKSCNARVIAAGNQNTSFLTQQFFPCSAGQNAKYVLRFNTNFSKLYPGAIISAFLWNFQIKFAPQNPDVWVSYTSPAISPSDTNGQLTFSFTNPNSADTIFFAVDNVSIKPLLN